MISRRILLALLTAACVLPMAIVIVAATGWLLGAMDDAAGARGLNRVALGLGIVWVIDLVCLVVAHAIHTLEPPQGPS